MDPKSFAGKPPSFDALSPELGGKLTELVARDMQRNKREKERKKAAAAGKPAPEEQGDRGGIWGWLSGRRGR
ncbi:MAG: hypothetical protein HOW73_38230 [Polyangiaceae bacterium]|nr:hypothetical protein [Polyangiaceae bacterium]